MASQSLISAVNSYDKYIEQHGIDEQVIDAYIQALSVAFRSENDVKYGLQQSAKTKSLIAKYVKEKTGGRVADLEVYAGDNDTSYKILDQFYNVLMYESAYLVDSFFYYIEVDEKDPWRRFYFPRRNVLKPVVGAYQEIYDGKLDFLSVSQPKRTGKTTGGLRLAQMMGGRDPDGSIFGVGKGEGLVKRFYGGLLLLAGSLHGVLSGR